MARRRRPGPQEAVRGSVYPLLDLHGLTGGEARVHADGWLRARQADGERTVVVVTGRGNRSGGLPVLRGEIERLLQELAEVVAAWEPADGGGAFRVTLRRLSGGALPGRDDASDEVLARRYGPELLHRAHEALWELGIAPTPALLRAEIRRLVGEEGGEPD